MIWILTPSEVTDPYLPVFLQDVPEETSSNQQPEKKVVKAPEPKALEETDTNEAHPHDINATQAEPVAGKKTEEAKTADADPPAIPEPIPKPQEPREPPADLKNPAILARILKEAIEDRELETRKRDRKELLYQDGKPFTGWAKRMRGKSGQVEFLGQYLNGLKDGPHANWLSGRRFRELIHYRAGLRNGLSVTWYGSRKKRDAIHYENDLKHGPATTWYGSGKKSTEGQYRHGEKDGVWTTFKGSGQENRKQAYENGNPLDE